MKSAVWVGFIGGSFVTNFILFFLGVDSFSFLGIFLSALGGGFGIWLGYRYLS